LVRGTRNKGPSCLVVNDTCKGSGDVSGVKSLANNFGDFGAFPSYF
jgi:hypothetical protein